MTKSHSRYVWEEGDLKITRATDNAADKRPPRGQLENAGQLGPGGGSSGGKRAPKDAPVAKNK
jgi:hypothetical protein